MLVTVSVALAAPVAVGVNVIVNGTLWPSGMVKGNDRPEILNSGLFVLAVVTVTLAPVAVRLPEPVPSVPTTTLPIARVVGLTPSCPTAAVPVPASGIVKVGLGAVDVMVILPLALPVLVGLNFTVNVAPWPAVSVTGAVIPLRVNPVPLIAT